MKKLTKLSLVSLLTILLVGVCAFSTLAVGESTITTNIFNDACGLYNATYETPIANNITFYGTGDIYSATIGSAKVTGFAADAGINYFFNEDYQGFYVGGGVGLISVTVSGGTYSGITGTGMTFGLNVQGGYKKILDNGLTLNGGYSLFNGLVLGIGLSF